MALITTTRTNLLANPSFELGMAGWPGHTNATSANTAAVSYAGSFSAMMTATATGGMRLYTPTGTGGIPITVGASYNFSAYVMAASAVTPVSAEILWYDAHGANVSNDVSTAVTDSTSWTRINLQSVAPSGAAYATVEVYWPSAGVGEVHYVDACLFAQTASLGTYFDGSTASAPGPAGYYPPAYYQYAWTGLTGMSTSIEQLVAPLQSYQVQMADGTIFGPGTSVNLVGVTSLRDLDGLRTGDAARGQSDGFYGGLNLLGERNVVITWELTMAPGGVEAAIQSLAKYFQNIQDPASVCMTSGDYLRQFAGVGTSKPVSALQFQLPGRSDTTLLLGRPTKFNVPIDLNYQWGQVQITTQWTSVDGTVYDATPSQGISGLPAPASGMSWPASWPWTWGASTGGGFQLTNGGDYPAYPVFVLQGPLSYPVITNVNTGQSMSLAISLGASDVLLIDHQAGVVTLNGTANRNGLVYPGASFFQIQPGTTTIDFASGDSVAVAGTLAGYCLSTYSAL